jgi:hypothetical protein
MYVNINTFTRDFLSKNFGPKLNCIKEYAARAKASNESQSFKVVVLFNSVSDSLP